MLDIVSTNYLVIVFPIFLGQKEDFLVDLRVIMIMRWMIIIRIKIHVQDLEVTFLTLTEEIKQQDRLEGMVF